MHRPALRACHAWELCLLFRRDCLLVPHERVRLSSLMPQPAPPHRGVIPSAAPFSGAEGPAFALRDHHPPTPRHPERSAFQRSRNGDLHPGIRRLSTKLLIKPTYEDLSDSVSDLAMMHSLTGALGSTSGLPTIRPQLCESSEELLCPKDLCGVDRHGATGLAGQENYNSVMV